ncbi:MAG TPA: hypothetical protein VGD56_00330 [Gemmatirosa sp.]
MRARAGRIAPVVLLVAAVALGVTTAAVDNVALDGEASPILVVAMLVGATAMLGTLASRRPWGTALAVWLWVPLAHLVKHGLGMPDTLHPNTYASILKLGVFSLVVAGVGTGCGVLTRRVVGGGTGAGRTSA